MFAIRDLHIQYPFLLAPMSGISDLPFRTINREFGCPFAFTEMINARALGLKNDKTLNYLRSATGDRPLGIQLLSGEPQYILHALDQLQGYQYDLLDLNAACPAPKVTRKGEGAALLREPVRLTKLVKTLVDNAHVPVSVKIRSGWDDKSINAVDLARRIEDAGADAICIHGRTRMQGYGGRVDLTIIEAVKAVVKVPVIASGDVFTARAALNVFKETGCDAVMVARGAWGNPWIFRDLIDVLRTGEEKSAPSLPELQAVMHKHLDFSVQYYGPTMGIVTFRKLFIWYTRGLVRARVLREQAVKINTFEEMKRLIDVLQMSRTPRVALPAHPSRSIDCSADSSDLPAA
jgi:tRNA-dihydrouridine synthase B